MKGWIHSWAMAGLMLATLACAAAAAVPFAVVKAAVGQVRFSQGKGQPQELKTADLISNGTRVETGKASKTSLRLQGDQSALDLKENTSLRLKLVKRDGKIVRKLILDRGSMNVNLKAKGEGAVVENAQTVAQVKSGRFAFTTDEQAVATFIVLNGELTVINHPKDQTALVHAGQKAVSDANGIKITDASESELEAVGMRQNNLEIDFQNPETDEVSTLEVDYETHY
jgi:ferric-dicitrate binding protein FerR (iron transport regulator)